MSVEIEESSHQLLKVTIDTTHVCNLACDYCLQGWKTKTHLPAERILDVFSASEEHGLLEVFLSGAEITLHPEFGQILRDSHLLQKTGLTMITNGTTMSPEMAKTIRDSNIQRVAISIDGPDAESHNSARGNNFDKVMRGLNYLQETGKSITVISVAHKKNVDKLLALSDFLTTRQLAQQHHIVAVSRAGLAKDVYNQMRLEDADFFHLQEEVDQVYQHYKNRGLRLIFTSFWQATGQRSQVRDPRQVTLFELGEQLQDCNLVVRVGGNVQLTSAAWAREFVNDGVVGNVHVDKPQILFQQAAALYSSGQAMQLPREVESGMKYGFGRDLPSDNDHVDDISVSLVPVLPISALDILQQPLETFHLQELAAGLTAEPERYRAVYASGGVHIVFDKHMSQATLLTQNETHQLSDFLLRENGAGA